jgi:PelA/Pel-15E family pectate lyase
MGTNSPSLPLTASRIAGLPPAQQPAWKDYLERSTRQWEADQAFFRSEMKAHGLSQATMPPAGNSARSIPLNKTAAWYAESEGRHIADIIVSFQTPAGGWSKNLDMSQHRRAPGECFAHANLSRYLTNADNDLPRDSSWNYVGTFDNDATASQLRFLAKVIAGVGPSEAGPYHAAFLRGLDYIIAAQYPNGGWPQVWPLEGGYHDAITFNDGAMLHVLELLGDVINETNQYAFVPQRTRDVSQESFKLGLECILATQIVSGGRRTVWGQQYDPLTLQPSSARNYEMPSQTAGESAEIMTCLMRLHQPGAQCVAAVTAAATWFEQTQIRDFAFRNTGDDGRHLVSSPGNGPIWARYYQIGTDRPIFGDRDKSIHDTVDEISKERRNGYAWFGNAPGRALEEYATWKKAHLSKRLLIIAPDAFHEVLQGFLGHKQRLMPAEIRSLETILRRGKGADDPEKLKRFLYEEWQQHQLGYALLVGDIDVFPVRFMVLDRVTPAAYDYAFYPSDLYYSDLAKADGSFDDWNAQKDSFHAGYFGEVRGEKNKQDPINFDQIDYLPDIAVGRWPVSTAAEALLVANKTITYEQAVLAGTSPQLHRAALFAVGGWVDGRGLMDSLAARLTNRWTVEKRYYSDARRQSGTQPPNHQQVCALLNEGVSLAAHIGHGEAGGWDQCFSLRDLDRLTNASRLPVLISAGCSTAYFAPLPPYDGYVDVNGKEHTGSDHQEVFTAPPPAPAPYQRGRFNPTGLGEQLLKHSANGAVAYIGCDTGGQPCGLTLVDGFVSAVAEANEPRLGDCWAQAIRYYYEHEHLATLKPNNDWYPPSIFFQGMKYMLFGDPSLRLPGTRAREK